MVAPAVPQQGTNDRQVLRQPVPGKGSKKSSGLVFIVVIFGALFVSLSSRGGMLEATDSTARKPTYGHYQYSAVNYFEEPKSAAKSSVIIITSLIPSHPALKMINATLASFRNLKGLPKTAPLFISVDKPKHPTPGQLKRLDQYIANLNATFGIQKHVTIIVAPHHVGISGNIKQAMDLVTTKYVHIVQHDFAFARSIDHKGIVQTMEEYPEDLQIVRFNKRANVPKNTDRGPCFAMKTPVDDVNGLRFTKTNGWSDNNHFTTKAYYERLFKLFDLDYTDYGKNFNLSVPTENLMMFHANRNCSKWGQHVYGPPNAPATLDHLDGRHKHPKPDLTNL